MAVPKLLKSTPFLASSGVVGVGGTSVIIWQATGKGASVPESESPLQQISPSIPTNVSTTTYGEEEDEDDTDDVSVQPNWVLETSSKSSFAQDSDILGSFNSTDTEDGYSNQVRTNNNIFKLKTYRCFDKFFGLGSLSHDHLWFNSSSFDANSVLAEPPNNISSNSLTGCSVMNLSHKDGSFLFRSEIVVKNDKFGLGLWTGLKGSKTDSNLSVNLVNYLLFFEKKSGSWSKSGGYAWGGHEHKWSTSSLTIKSPDESSINKTFDKDTGNSSGDMNYFGVWKPVEDSSGKELLNFEKTETYYSSSDSFDFSLPFKVRVSADIKGYYGSESAGRSRSWIKYNGSHPDSSRVPASVDEWAKLIKGKKGSWKSMSEHCEGKDNLDDTEKSNSLCYSKQ